MIKGYFRFSFQEYDHDDLNGYDNNAVVGKKGLKILFGAIIS